MLTSRSQFLATMAAMASLNSSNLPVYNGPWPGEKTIRRWEEPCPEGEATPEQKVVKPKKAGKKTRAQRRRDAKKLDNQIEAASQRLGKSLKALLDSSICAVCGEKASGMGGDAFYCEKHFWPAFDAEHGGSAEPSLAGRTTAANPE